MQNILGVSEGIIVVLLSTISLLQKEFEINRLYSYLFLPIGLTILLASCINIKAILMENPKDITTEHLTDIRIIPAGYHNMDRKLEGFSNGQRSSFMIRGADKVIAESIKKSGQECITISYHSSNRRIESIK